MTWIVGLTGGIGAGKTLASNAFASLGVPVIDTDLISHALTAPNGLAIDAIHQKFGDELFNDAGQLDRAKMRELVFKDAEKRQALEAILHPLIAQVAMASIAQHSDAPYVILAVPLLAESSAWLDRCDRVLVIDCEVETQIERVMARSGLSREQTQAIIMSQASREARKAIANEVIVNESTPEHVTQQVTRLHDFYLRMASQSLKSGEPV